MSGIINIPCSRNLIRELSEELQNADTLPILSAGSGCPRWDFYTLKYATKCLPSKVELFRMRPAVLKNFDLLRFCYSASCRRLQAQDCLYQTVKQSLFCIFTTEDTGIGTRDHNNTDTILLYMSEMYFFFMLGFLSFFKSLDQSTEMIKA